MLKLYEYDSLIGFFLSSLKINPCSSPMATPSCKLKGHGLGASTVSFY